MPRRRWPELERLFADLEGGPRSTGAVVEAVGFVHRGAFFEDCVVPSDAENAVTALRRLAEELTRLADDIEHGYGDVAAMQALTANVSHALAGVTPRGARQARVMRAIDEARTMVVLGEPERAACAFVVRVARLMCGVRWMEWGTPEIEDAINAVPEVLKAWGSRGRARKWDTVNEFLARFDLAASAGKRGNKSTHPLKAAWDRGH